jgi:hypothetical protein
MIRASSSRIRMILRTLLTILIAPALLAADDAAFFEKTIRPLLTERCVECHGSQTKIKGGLRLDSREGWATGGDSGPAIIPGQPDQSLLIKAIRYHDRDLQMPESRKLPDQEISALEHWVRIGAPDPRTGGAFVKKQTGLSLQEGRKFWSYRPVTPAPVPAVKNAAWPWTEIDQFLLAKAEANAIGIVPATDASLIPLVRRLYVNLTGLPPSPPQIDAFVRSASLDRRSAIARLTAELLASRRFGEHWGRHWLDVARFAESSGGGRTLLFKDAWRYRDYVIESVNADVPFPQFVREQIAGDLLPTSSAKEQRHNLTATAFLALGPTNYEEQEKQQLRFDIIDEQIETMGRAFLGQTLGCARCHDHKFDPVPQRDYYALAGILASTRTLLNYTDNVARWIDTPLPFDGSEETAFRDQEARIACLENDLKAAQAELAAISKDSAVETTTPGQPIPAGKLPGIVIDDADAKLVGEWTQSTTVPSYIGSGYAHDGNTGKGEKTVTFTPMLPEMGRYEVRLAYVHSENRANNARVTILHADGEETVLVDQTEPPPLDGHFISLGTYRFEKDGAGFVLVSNAGTTGFVTVDALQFLPEQLAAASEPAGNPSRQAVSSRVKRLETELKQARKSGPVRPVAMAVADDPAPCDAQIRIRGVEKQRGDAVPRGFLQVATLGQAPSIPADRSGRLELANWIASPENPLTARVFVNRTWAWLFGTGIVRTVDNLGTTGEQPSHPELLDYLTARFVAEGWSWKRLISEIVTSRAWQLASDGSAEAEDHFLAAKRRRLDAEQIRDTMLAASGRLDLSYLGPNIAGAGGIDANSTTAQNIEYGYVYADLRRSVYTPAFRNNRLELFAVFDFADINAPSGQRNASTIAPQALYLLNHPFAQEQARSAAELTQRLPEQERLTSAFRRTLGRDPSPQEQAACSRFLGARPSAEDWAQLQQTLFASADFRYLD